MGPVKEKAEQAAAEATKLTVESFEGPIHPDWCAGCGDFGVLAALKKALVNLQLQPRDVLVVSGIGCSSNLPGFIHAYGLHSLHGRAVAIASGAYFGNHDLKIIVTGGDGDGYGIGLGHFVHAMRRNLDITYVVMNNHVYGLTTGQASPTSLKGQKTKSTPRGNIEIPLNPIALAISTGATFVARGFSGQQPHLTDLFTKAIAHKGFSLVDVFSPCVTYYNSYPFYKDNTYKLEEAGHDPADLPKALDRAFEWGEKKVPIGLFWKTERPTYVDEDIAFQNGPLAKQPLRPPTEKLKAALQEFM